MRQVFMALWQRHSAPWASFHYHFFSFRLGTNQKLRRIYPCSDGILDVNAHVRRELNGESDGKPGRESAAMEQLKPISRQKHSQHEIAYSLASARGCEAGAKCRRGRRAGHIAHGFTPSGGSQRPSRFDLTFGAVTNGRVVQHKG